MSARSRSNRRIAAIVVLTVAGCTAEPPSVDVGPTEGVGKDPSFADVVLVKSDEGGVVACESLPADCPTTGPCAEHATLGPPDGSTFVLEGPQARLELGFLCSQILERGAAFPEADFRLWATVPAGAEAVVAVSLDGSTYRDVDVITADDPELDLQRTGVEVARFVRITVRAGGGIAVDAIEALGEEP